MKTEPAPDVQSSERAIRLSVLERLAHPAKPLSWRTFDSYVISIGTQNFTERYYRDKTGWLKVSARGRTYRMTAEQVLNHVLPALAGIKPDLTIKVEQPSSVVQAHTVEASRRGGR